MTDSIRERERAIVSEFETLGDWVSRYEHLIAMGDAMPRRADAIRSDENHIPGCQSELWIHAAYEASRNAVFFEADSDARITRGMAALIIRVVDGQPPESILEAELGFLDAIGLRTHLSAQRRNGLAAMIHWMKNRARVYMETDDDASDRNGRPSPHNEVSSA